MTITSTQWYVGVLLGALACAVAVGNEEKRSGSDGASRPPVQLRISAGKIENGRFCVHARMENSGKEGVYVLAIGHYNDVLDVRDSKGRPIKPLDRGFVTVAWHPSAEDYVFLRPGDVFETTWEYDVGVMKLPNEGARPVLADNGDKKHDTATSPSVRCIVRSNTLYPVPEKKYSLRVGHGPGSSYVTLHDDMCTSVSFDEYFGKKQLAKVIVSNWIELSLGDGVEQQSPK
jgi:hypothetical protein